MDITETLAPASDQLDAIELVSGPRIFTVDRVTKGNAEQPVNVYFRDFPRPWRPGKTMRRLLAACWGAESSTWSGRAVELYYDPEVTFGKDRTGGTRVKRLTDIEKTRRLTLPVSRGKYGTFVVEPLDKAEALRAEWKSATPERRAAIEAEVNQLAKEDR